MNVTARAVAETLVRDRWIVEDYKRFREVSATDVETLTFLGRLETTVVRAFGESPKLVDWYAIDRELAALIEAGVA